MRKEMCRYEIILDREDKCFIEFIITIWDFLMRRVTFFTILRGLAIFEKKVSLTNPKNVTRNV